jgi:hypothetical protein
MLRHFRHQDLGYDDRFAKGPCYGDPFGRDCRCHWEAHDLHLELITPQNIDGKVLQFAVPNCSIWTRGGTPWNRKSGVLKVSRVVRTSDRHLAWIFRFSRMLGPQSYPILNFVVAPEPDRVSPGC